MEHIEALVLLVTPVRCILVDMVKIFLALLVGSGLGAASYWYYMHMDSDSNKGRTKEAVICSSTVRPRCFKYRCETGYLPQIPPPGGAGVCSDGKAPIQGDEVETHS